MARGGGGGSFGSSKSGRGGGSKGSSGSFGGGGFNIPRSSGSSGPIFRSGPIIRAHLPAVLIVLVVALEVLRAAV